MKEFLARSVNSALKLIRFMFKRMADRRIEDHQYSVHIAHYYYLYASLTQAVELLLN